MTPPSQAGEGLSLQNQLAFAYEDDRTTTSKGHAGQALADHPA